MSFILILFTLALFFNNAANWHFHKLPNGVVIEHAHPYATFPSSETPWEEHQHSDLEYLILDTVYHAALILIIVYAGLTVFERKKAPAVLFKPAYVISNRYTELPFLRAPPSF